MQIITMVGTCCTVPMPPMVRNLRFFTITNQININKWRWSSGLVNLSNIKMLMEMGTCKYFTRNHTAEHNNTQCLDVLDTENKQNILLFVHEI